MTSRSSRSLRATPLESRAAGRSFEHVERRDSKVDEVIIGRAGQVNDGRRERCGPAQKGRAACRVEEGSQESSALLRTPIRGLAGHNEPASA
eukprot:2292635-Prymnesium_polylepis.1